MGTASHIPQYQLANQQRQSKLEQSLPPEDTALVMGTALLFAGRFAGQ